MPASLHFQVVTIETIELYLILTSTNIGRESTNKMPVFLCQLLLVLNLPYFFGRIISSHDRHQDVHYDHFKQASKRKRIRQNPFKYPYCTKFQNFSTPIFPFSAITAVTPMFSRVTWRIIVIMQLSSTTRMYLLVVSIVFALFWKY